MGLASDVELDAAVAWLEASEIVFGAVVFFGVALEVLLAVINPPYGFLLERWGPVFADGCVALGVLGEIGASARITLCQGEQLRRSDSKLEEAHRLAAAAQGQAATAWTQAAEASEEAQNALALAITSQGQAASASNRADQALRDLALANERAAKLEKEAADIRRAAAWRELSPEQRNRLVAVLTPISAGIRITYPFSDPEATMYCGAFYEVFRQAGWQIQLASRTFLGPPVGVFVTSGNVWSDEIQVEIEQMREIFAEAGIRVEKGSGSVEIPDSGRTIGIAAARVNVLIGHKPPPDLE